MHWSGGHMLFGGWWMMLFWIGVAVLFVWGLRQFLGNAANTHSQNLPSLSALEIAKQRYARGELSRDDYLALIDDLKYETTTTSKMKRSE